MQLIGLYNILEKSSSNTTMKSMKRCLSVDSPDYKALVEIMMDTYTEKLSAHDWAGMGRICIVSQDTTCLLDLSTQRLKVLFQSGRSS